MNNINIAIVDDHDLFREGIKLVLNQINGFQVVFDTSNGYHFLEMLEKAALDVVLMDIEMPVINGIETTKKAIQLKPDLKIIALTMFSDTVHYTQMMTAGVKGFVIKKANKFELEQAILAVFQGGNYFSQEILQKMAFNYFGKTSGKDLLSNREIEIIVHICNGFTSQEIADKLYISSKTVETHRSNIFMKAEVKNTAGLIVWAIKNNFFSVS